MVGVGGRGPGGQAWHVVFRPQRLVFCSGPPAHKLMGC